MRISDWSSDVCSSDLHWVNNALAVIAAVDALGGDLAAAGLALADLKGLPGRGARRRISIGGESALLIDESYNANPAPMAAALRVLGETPATGRTIDRKSTRLNSSH